MYRKTVMVGRVDQRTGPKRVFQASDRWTDRRADGQPENIMPPAPKGGGIKIFYGTMWSENTLYSLTMRDNWKHGQMGRQMDKVIPVYSNCQIGHAL